MKDTIEEKLKQITLKVTRKPDAEFSGQTTFQDLDADSMDKVQILIALEEEFGIEIPDEEIATIETMGEFVEYIQAKLSVKESGAQD
ncbi:MAG: acyl carrier protein [Dehalococcoidales bacterium]